MPMIKVVALRDFLQSHRDLRVTIVLGLNQASQCCVKQFAELPASLCRHRKLQL